MNMLSDIWDHVRTAMIGLKITVPYIWKKPVTLMYPHERLVQPERARNRLYVNMDDCIGCDQCSRACPVNCIDIETVKAVDGDSPGVTSNGKKKALWVTRFDIDIAKCCYCGLCTFPCPTECIKMTDVFEFAEQERNNLIYTYITLTPEEIVEKIEVSKRADEELAAKKAAAKAAEAEAPKADAAASAKATPAAPPAGTDPEKAAKIAEMQAKMAAAKAKAAGETPAATAPAPAPAGADAEKAAKIAEMQARIAAAKAKAAGGAAPEPAAAPTPAAEPPAAATPAAPPAEAAPAATAPAADEDPEKAARIAAMKAKIEEAKRLKGN